MLICFTTVTVIVIITCTVFITCEVIATGIVISPFKLSILIIVGVLRRVVFSIAASIVGVPRRVSTVLIAVILITLILIQILHPYSGLCLRRNRLCFHGRGAAENSGSAAEDSLVTNIHWQCSNTEGPCSATENLPSGFVVVSGSECGIKTFVDHFVIASDIVCGLAAAVAADDAAASAASGRRVASNTVASAIASAVTAWSSVRFAGQCTGGTLENT
jgi:hypothetical protein